MGDAANGERQASYGVGGDVSETCGDVIEWDGERHVCEMPGPGYHGGVHYERSSGDCWSYDHRTFYRGMWPSDPQAASEPF